MVGSLHDDVVVGAHEHRRAELAERPHRLHHRACGRVVELRRGLVGHHQLGATGQGGGERDPLLLPAGQRVGSVVGPRCQPDSGEQVVREHKRKKGGGRRKLPADLPRRIETVEPGAEERRCRCGREKTRIREEHSEKLDYVPARFEVVRTVRGVWACQRCHDGVTV